QLGTAIQTGDEDALQRLLAAILPVLLASAGVDLGLAPAGGTAGAGTVSSGPATAVGNRSSTEAQQLAAGAATPGTRYIGQDALVVNAGVASATTGGNQIGGNQIGSGQAGGVQGGAAALDAQGQAVVAQLSSFIASLLTEIDAWTAGDGAAIGGSSLSL